MPRPAGPRRLLLLGCLLLAPPGAACPPPCACSEPARTVKCVRRELSAVPAGIPAYTRTLFITGTRLARLARRDFRGLPALATLSLAGNRIATVETGAFSVLPSLRSLDLSNNRLAAVHPDAFGAGNSSLWALNLSRALHNASALPPLAAAIARGGFRNLSRLELASNGIVYLPPGLFSGLAGLRHLDLRNNSLVDIKSTTFAGLDLERLDLTANALKTLRAEALAELGRQPRLQLFLRDNPFVCSCDIEDLAGWLNRSRQAADAEQLTCAFPQALQNTSLLALAGAQLGCHSSPHGERALQTSYALLGAVLGLLGVAFLFVLYLNRRGLKGWVSGTRGACRSLLEERRYRYEMRAESRAARVSALAM